jgi:hypothetical protein
VRELCAWITDVALTVLKHSTYLISAVSRKFRRIAGPDEFLEQLRQFVVTQRQKIDDNIRPGITNISQRTCLAAKN